MPLFRPPTATSSSVAISQESPVLVGPITPTRAALLRQVWPRKTAAHQVTVRRRPECKAATVPFLRITAQPVRRTQLGSQIVPAPRKVPFLLVTAQPVRRTQLGSQTVPAPRKVLGLPTKPDSSILTTLDAPSLTVLTGMIAGPTSLESHDPRIPGLALRTRVKRNNQCIRSTMDNVE